MPHKLFTLLLCFSFTLFISCGSDYEGNDIVEEQVAGEAQDFSTRLDNDLLIAGTKCDGGERVPGADDECERDQWLITVDNVNTCEPNGACTEVAVDPFIAELERTDIVSLPEFFYYEIRPETPISQDKRSELDDVYVRIDLNGETEVVRRDSI